jgi:hypothetical protein
VKIGRTGQPVLPKWNSYKGQDCVILLSEPSSTADVQNRERSNFVKRLNDGNGTVTPNAMTKQGSSSPSDKNSNPESKETLSREVDDEVWNIQKIIR